MFLDDIVMAVGVVEGLFFCFEAVRGVECFVEHGAVL